MYAGEITWDVLSDARVRVCVWVRCEIESRVYVVQIRSGCAATP